MKKIFLPIIIISLMLTGCGLDTNKENEKLESKLQECKDGLTKNHFTQCESAVKYLNDEVANNPKVFEKINIIDFSDDLLDVLTVYRAKMEYNETLEDLIEKVKVAANEYSVVVKNKEYEYTGQYSINDDDNKKAQDFLEGLSSFYVQEYTGSVIDRFKLVDLKKYYTYDNGEMEISGYNLSFVGDVNTTDYNLSTDKNFNAKSINVDLIKRSYDLEMNSKEVISEIYSKGAESIVVMDYAFQNINKENLRDFIVSAETNVLLKKQPISSLDIGDSYSGAIIGETVYLSKL